jgi:aconitate hydratase
MVDASYPRHAREAGDHAIIGGRNHGQGLSREHAALAPRYLGLRVLITKGFARIHWQNLVNFGILPLTLDDEVEYDRMDLGDILQLRDLHKQIRRDRQVEVRNATKYRTFKASHALSERKSKCCWPGG